MEERSSLGPQANIIAGLSYVAGLITGFIFFFIEKTSRFVKFNALQSIIISILSIAIGIINPVLTFTLGWLPGMKLVISLVTSIINIVIFIFWIIGMIKAFIGEIYKIPIVGDVAEAILAGNANMKADDAIIVDQIDNKDNEPK